MDWADGVENWACSEYGNAERIEYQTTAPTLLCDKADSENRFEPNIAPKFLNNQVMMMNHDFGVSHD